MKPIYKSIIDFDNFFKFLHIEIKEIIIIDEYERILFEDSPAEFLKCYPSPGLHIHLNGLEASFLLNYSSDTAFRRFFLSIQHDILTELQKNINCSTSNKELKEYFAKLKSILYASEKNIVETQNKFDSGIQCKFTYSNSKITITVWGIPFEELPEERLSKDLAEESLSNLLHWIKDQIRTLIINVDKIIATVKPIIIDLKSIKSFEFTKPKYYPSKISYVFNDLRNGDFIEIKAKPEQLGDIFINTQIASPIKWIAGEANLYYFIKQLIKMGIIIDPKRNIWKKTIACFVNKDGFLFKADELRGSKATKRASEIESIVRKFLS